MSKDKKIANNPTAKEMTEQIKAFGYFDALYQRIPFAKKLFPKLEKISTDFSKLREKASIVLLPDQFNELFSQHGWIAYESMNADVMRAAIELHDSEHLLAAEEFLTDSYDQKTLEFGIVRFNGNLHFRKRIRLAELAQEDYLCGRYHACVPLLLSLLDGLVNDVSKHVGFFAENVDLTAWDCIAAHETGLQTLAAVLSKGRNKTNEDTIDVPYRNGILHGRELAFDNKLVAAKCWAALFAARDWAVSIEDGKKEPQQSEKISWKQLLNEISETNRMNKAVDEWQPRDTQDLPYLPFEGSVKNLPENTPELAVGLFLDHWCNKRFGPIAEALLDFSDTSAGKKAGIAREDFGNYIPTSFKILSIDDQAASVAHVIVEVNFEVDGASICKNVSIRTIYQDAQNNPSVRSFEGGHWAIVQNSFSEIIYAPQL